jgi:hypothetical protein
MRKEVCELCGYQSELGDIEKHHIVPKRVTDDAGIQESKVVRLCRSCREEVDAWYSQNVLDMAYDSMTKQFRQKSPAEIVKEYEAAYRVFAAYKKGQREIA